MGLAIEVIQSLDETGNLICSRFPASGEADLKLGAQLIVRESQSAVFMRGGKALDTFGPGRHTLTTANVPLLGELLKIPFGGQTPFKAEVMFVNHKVFTNLKWGTREPILFRDAELAMVRLRAFGIMSFRVENAQLFLNNLVGTKGSYTQQAIEDFLRGIIIARLTDFLGENLKTVFDLPRYFDELAAGTKARVKDDFGKYGMVLEDLLINSISPPEEVQKRIDERSGMAAMGNLDQYMKFKTALAVEEAAKNPGGAAGAGMGAGLGMGMGMMMPGMMAGAAQAAQAPAQPPAQAPAAAGPTCAKCGAANAAGAKFCSGCGEKLALPGACAACGTANAAGAKFCANCGKPLGGPARCAACQAELPAGAKFCGGCGAKVA